MTDILYRGKAINRDPNQSYRTTYQNGDWVYGLVSRLDKYYHNDEMTNEDGVSGIDIDRATIGQYTSLSDKNGKKIFEGDILIIDEYSTFESTGKGIVKFYKGKFVSFYGQDAMGRDCYDDLYTVCNERVIAGNIHDNPELLERGNK